MYFSRLAVELFDGWGAVEIYGSAEKNLLVIVQHKGDPQKKASHLTHIRRLRRNSKVSGKENALSLSHRVLDAVGIKPKVRVRYHVEQAHHNTYGKCVIVDMNKTIEQATNEAE